MSTESGLSIVLVGSDGQAWDLTDPTSGVALLAQTFEGLHIEDIDAQTVSSARIAGQRRFGKSVKPRDVTFSVRVGDQEPPYRTGEAWRLLDSEFWQSIGVGRPCELIINDRTLTVSLDGSTAKFDKDPALRGKGVYTLEMVADWPYFAGQEVTFDFDLTPSIGTNVFGGGPGTKAPVFAIGVPDATKGAAVSNNGDVDAWLRWTLVGPGTFKVGVSESIVTIPFVLSTGQTVEINTDPLKQTIVNKATGANLWPSMGTAPVRFAPVPPGNSRQISVNVQGAQAGTMVRAAITPQFSRAW